MENGEKIVQVNIENQMKAAYIDYSMSVIVARALPDVRDGLKPVHRRVLFGMSELGVFSNRPYKKSARIVGEVLGKYHPHGDTSVYDAMVRMAQDPSDPNIIYAESQGGNISRLDYRTGESKSLVKPAWRPRYLLVEDSILVERGDSSKPATSAQKKRIAPADAEDDVDELDGEAHEKKPERAKR
jgi:hypothetical protein